MRGTVKFFNNEKGWGFIYNDETNEEDFLHYTNIRMPCYRTLDEGDLVEYEIALDDGGKRQAVNVTPILTRRMVENVLRSDNLHLDTIKDVFGRKLYMVVDKNNVIQTGEQGMTLIEVAKYAGIDVQGLEQ